MSVVTAVLQAPVNTILIFAGIVIVFFTLFNIDLGNKTIGLRTTDKSNTLIVIIAVIFGAGFIVGGLLYKSNSAPSGDPTLVPGITISTQTPLPAVEAPSQTPAAQPVLIVSTDTPIPTSAPQIKTLADGCISAQTWQAASIDAAAKAAVSTSNGCLNAEGLHITTDQFGTLHFVVTKAGKDKLASGIYRSIQDNSVIEFSVTVRKLFILYQGDPAATLTFAIAPQDQPMGELGSGRFKFIADSLNGPVVYFTAGADQAAGSKVIGQHPDLQKAYSIKLELSGLSMKIYINNVNAKEVVIPQGPKVLYIGYSLAPASGADVEISGLKINGQTP
jgi:hypothetical protein